VAIMSLLVGTMARSPVTGDATYAILVSLIGGCIQLFMGIFQLGTTIDNDHFNLLHERRTVSGEEMKPDVSSSTETPGTLLFKCQSFVLALAGYCALYRLLMELR
jgi:hypothetical protein